jgi:hypothetical protein
MRLSDPAVVMVIVSGMTGFAYSVKSIANAVVRYRETGRNVAELAGPGVSDDRLARLESAVEAIAIEVERISEGQRFTTRLLTEQRQPQSLGMPRPGKFDTPH